MALTTGKKAPDFTSLNDDGNKVKLSDFKGKWIVLYFYPKDNTSGCTKEACDFRDNMKRITKTGAVVLGVSPDSVKSHVGFKSKFELNFTLISDSDKTICNAYNVMGEKTLYGRKYIGVIRTTYIIDEKGIIKYVNPKVSVEGHVDEIINKLKELKSK
ncbi:MAG: thioredoxin-dependent thiol peroxidase [Bacteroidetes bacterium]|nr:MAG: thioredoxin-dependent thiol peroxidase [Bacteroidota bacterium]